MHSRRTVPPFVGWTMFLLGILCLTAAWQARLSGTDAEARLVRQEQTYRWVILGAEKIASGTTIPQDTHVVFHLPDSFESIVRETLFGHEGERVRYWGYCFPANYDPTKVSSRTGFPGLLFLSEKERAVRAAQEARRRQRFTVANLPTEEDLRELEEGTYSPIRHQVEIFRPSSMCYIMTEDALAIGLDPDMDRLNNKLEQESQTDPAVPDTDGDGIMDGVEYASGMLPLIRDSDEDGIIDGIEDANWNGRVDIGETDPRVWDSDRDGLCDGMCRTKLKDQYYFMGEDQNLNGIVDAGETDPRVWDTDGDGVSDHLEFAQCLATGAQECP